MSGYPFSSYIYKDENQVVEALLGKLSYEDVFTQSVVAKAISLVDQARLHKAGGQLEAFLQEFSLNTEEGLAMMCLAEALLRIPDAATANALIKDKVVAANWLQQQGGGSKDWMAKAAGIGMAITRKALESKLAKVGEPVIREAMVRAMQMMGRQFVLGSNISDAYANFKAMQKQGYRMSYDMLGEGARDYDTAEKYFDSYKKSLEYISANNGQLFAEKSGISVKLSALHPRYAYAQKGVCVPVILKRLKVLCEMAAQAGVPLTIDAEEVHRLEISLEIFDALLRHEPLAQWEGLGLAVQAYQKRALPLIDYLADRAKACGRKIQVRLVKGAYWDSEIKYAQMGGFVEYPVFTRKCNTDVSYMACAQAMIGHSDVIYPMFATHNAHSVAYIYQLAQAAGVDYEFQRLHGMGVGLYAALMAEHEVRVSVYAPVGPHRELLPYLVRRLLENGANSSFVNQLLDKGKHAEEIVRDPVAIVQSHNGEHRHPSIPLPEGIFGVERKNSKGIDFDDPASSNEVLRQIQKGGGLSPPHSIVMGKRFSTLDDGILSRGVASAVSAFVGWNARDVNERAEIIERFGDLMEERMAGFMAALVQEGGKTILDARDEVREAIDFCRYYAARGRKDFNSDGILMSGYTGESNHLRLVGRGVFVCISPWNFPLAIFTGQVVAALVAGNSVLAKPASQTRGVAELAVKAMHEAGVPEDVLQLFLGDGAFGSKMIAHEDVAGVVFTGSTATAKRIQSVLVESKAGIVPFIAETGGQNAMIVDSSALLEQVVDDVLHSAFGSAGQRCSALRVLYIQDDVAEPFLELLKGAMQTLVVGDPAQLLTDVGPVIDRAACDELLAHKDYMSGNGTLIAEVEIDGEAAENGRYFAPVAYEIQDISVLRGEVFGPVLHVIRYKAEDLDGVIEQVNSTGFGLTFGLHSRIQGRQEKIARRVRAGNVYVNRGMTGAIVGVQPFGGMGLSGTGPKAGGPHYLHVFAIEQVVSVDTTASGGNASLVSLED